MDWVGGSRGIHRYSSQYLSAHFQVCRVCRALHGGFDRKNVRVGSHRTLAKVSNLLAQGAGLTHVEGFEV